MKDINLYRSIYVPILPLDIILKNIDYTFISFLSIDVEGLNFNVLQGAPDVTRRTLIICIEFDEEIEKSSLQNFLGDAFEVIGIFSCNIIFLNRALSSQLLQNK